PVLDKPRLYRIAAAASIETPAFWDPRNADELDAVLAGLDFERHSYVFSLPPTSPEPADPDALRYTVPAGTDRNTARARAVELGSRARMMPMLQEVVEGAADRCIGVVMLADERHRPLGWRVVRRRTLYPYFRAGQHSYGGNVHCESVHDDEAGAGGAPAAARGRPAGGRDVGVGAAGPGRGVAPMKS